MYDSAFVDRSHYIVIINIKKCIIVIFNNILYLAKSNFFLTYKPYSVTYLTIWLYFFKSNGEFKNVILLTVLKILHV